MDFDRLLDSLTNPNTEQDGWVRINEFSDLLGSLRTLATLFELTKHDVTAWKWVVLCLHNCVQGTAICLLTRSDGFGALKDRIEDKVDKFYQGGKNSFDDADEFIKLCKKSDMAPLPDLLRRLGYNYPRDDKVPSRTTDHRLHFLVTLHNWRNLFAHYPPQEWSAKEETFLEMFEVILQVVREELWSEKWKRRPLFTIDELRPLLDKLDRNVAERRASLEGL